MKKISMFCGKTLEDGKERAIKQVSDMIRHNVFSVESKKELKQIGDELNEEFVNRVAASLDSFREKHGLVRNANTDKEGVRLGGDEDPETVSPGRLRRFRGPL